MSKFFVEKSNIHKDRIEITGGDVHHIKKVLRLKCRDNIIVSDGEGCDYLVAIESFEADKIITSIVSYHQNSSEPPVNLVLFQGIPKSDKMDYIIQKSVELGVTQIVPVVTERTVVRFSGEKDAAAKTSRWQRISLEAAKQCNRGVVPKVELPVSFDEAVKLSEGFDLNIMPYEKESGIGLRECLRDVSARKVSVLIGPEGGFSDKEVVKAVSANFKPVTLGPRILRTETAGIAVLSILMYVLGDVG